jgi:hypothetical protein
LVADAIDLAITLDFVFKFIVTFVVINTTTTSISVLTIATAFAISKLLRA